MANPVAAHTFDFVRVYLSTRDLAPPGSGAWSNPVIIFDGSGDLSKSSCDTFSAGALGPSDPNNGIIGQCIDKTAGNVQRLTFLGNGIPDTPRTITFAGSIAPIVGDDYWDTSQGAWTFGGARYVALANGTHVVIIKSSDDFATPAAIQDAANGPPSTTDGYKAAIQRIDNSIYVFTSSDNTGTAYGLWIFDLTTDTWSGPHAALTGASFNEFGNSTDTFTNGFFRFPNGDLLILFSGFVGGFGVVAQLQFYNSGTVAWSAPQILPGRFYANAVIDPSFEQVHILTYGVFGVNGEVHYSTFDHAGEVINPDIDIIPGPSHSEDGVGHCSIQGGMLFVPRDDFADLDNAVWVAAIPVTVPFVKELLPVPATEKGAISFAGLNPGSSGYVVNDTGTINGGLLSATYKVTAVTTNALSSVSLNAAGTGYSVNDTGTILTGSTAATYRVLAVGGGGAITNFALTSLGAGYSVAAGVGTTVDSGPGTGFKLNILSVFSGVSHLTITYPGAGYAVASGVGTTTGGAQPGVGTGLTIDILSVTTGGDPSCAYMMFPNGYVLTPVTLSIVCPVSPGTLTVGVPFTTAAPVVTGGTAPFTFALLSGPSWLNIHPTTGAVFGTPTMVGGFTYTIQVTDSLGSMASVPAPCPLSVGGAPPPPPPPEFCIINPTPGTSPTLIAYDEPLENQGS